MHLAPASLSFRGEQLRPGDPGSDEARRVFNGAIDRRPRLIARCAGADDVKAAIALARDAELPLAIYGGGHSVAGHSVCDDGVMIDLRPMNRIDVDPATRTAYVEAGATWGDVDAATQAHGLAVTGGRVSATGVVGLTLGSGSGWLERKLGFACDNLLEIELVTARGELVKASEHENAELFWGLRGGSGNFGVVTALRFKLHPVGPLVLAGMLLFPRERAGEVLRAYRDFMRDAPDEVGGGFALICAPPEPFVPEHLRLQPVCGLILTYAGDLDAGERVLAPLRTLGGLDLIQPMPYVALQRMLDPACPKGMQNYWTADFLGGLPDDAIEMLVAGVAPSPLTQVLIAPGGGALSRVPDDATAMGHRQAPWNVHYLSMWADPADTERNVEWTRALAAAMKPWTTGGLYLNYIGDEGDERVRAAFGAKYERLQALKERWDPQNLFRSNQNITPRRAAP
jgi:FAD/FMN-containing dehydrogenase